MIVAIKTKIATPKWRECAAFYQRVFAMTVAETWDEPGDKGVILALRDGAGEAFVELYDSDDAQPGDAVSLQFKTPDLAAFLDALPEEIAYRGPTPRPWGAVYAYLRDPAGVGVVVYESGGL